MSLIAKISKVCIIDQHYFNKQLYLRINNYYEHKLRSNYYIWNDY